ncbi:hypothetical protein A2765_06625 [Candidatus Kaiserbacteria bacterium RIFCSPHIGHO2_01_FULL_56_24]|uniref:PE-PGRS family protein n=1 Tax=Candidatus Kaiserbacteria bacterium RIFCSPHIGHO2_01_FULL_56_24 TaxID=1798487 RepID=A0A1F6D8T8_9BACT|nr:MAG: hypothetical protein A2765_06625 [Candidatus Kaiserbacteria bacterium RIFCSPHIGHO2_01_FULL_56_24]
MTKSITLNYTVAALVAAALVLFSAAPAFAAINSSYIKIETKNSGKITNVTSSKADTGDNYAGGSYGGDGGNGGDVEAEAEAGDDYKSDASANGNNGGALAGDGGNGGNASFGGTVKTGDATSVADTQNGLNSTEVDLDVKGDMNSTVLKVEADNAEECGCNEIKNDTKSRARTGDNRAKGSYGGDGGRGGEIEAEAEADGDGDAEANGNNGGAVAGNGGTGGSGDAGGLVETGEADSTSGTINLLNTLLVRLSIL